MSLKGTEEETGGGDGHAELEAEAGVTPPQAKERLGQQSWKGLGKPPLAPPGGAALPARGCGTWLRDGCLRNRRRLDFHRFKPPGL